MSGRRNLLGVLLAAGAVALVPTLSVAAAPPQSGTPATPTSVSASGGNKSLGVSWSESSTGSSITFVASAHGSGRIRSCTTKRLSCSIVSLNNGAIYDVTVIARDKDRTSSPSSAASARVGVPGAPRNVRVSTASAALSVEWTVPVASGASKLTNYMATASPGGYSCSTAGTILSQPPARTCVITGLTPGATYTVTVTATNVYGTGAPSAGVAAIA